MSEDFFIQKAEIAIICPCTLLVSYTYAYICIKYIMYIDFF